jgi:hypothetical protein
MQSQEADDSVALSRARKAISEGQALLVAVDSNAFFEGTGKDRRVSFNRNWMKKFRGLAARGERLLISSVWDIEVRRHFRKSIDSQVTIKVPTLARVASNKKEIDDLNSRASALRLDAAALVEREWDSVKESFNTKLVAIPTDPDLATRIFALWAHTDWPFEAKKPDEFQDAFALLSLQAYTENLRLQVGTSDACVLVVTADSGCREFCKRTNTLIPCSSIDAAVEFLIQRQEINRLAERSRELSETFSDPNHELFRQLRQSFSETIQQGFPPRTFSFDLTEQRRSGWLRSFYVDSILPLPSGPRGSLVEAIEERDNNIRIAGRVRFQLAITLTEPRYTEGTACPSSEVILSDYKCQLDMDFNAGQHEGHWYGGISAVPQHLTASEH